MIDTTNMSALIGATVVDSNDDKIGTVGQIYVDPDNGNPSWASVKTGLFGNSESFVPLQDATSETDKIHVSYDKSFVKDAPRIDADGGPLNEREEEALFQYYNDSFSGSQSGEDSAQYGGGATNVDAHGVEAHDRDASQYNDTAASTGHDTSGPNTDDAMTRSEEQLHVGTERVESGRARLRKYVVTEDQNVTVPVSHEEVRLDREPITSGNVGAATDGPAISEEEHEVVLTEERAVVTKETVPVERVKLGTETVTGSEQVNEQVRKEQVELEGDPQVASNR